MAYDAEQLTYTGLERGSLFPSVSATDSAGIITVTAVSPEAPLLNGEGHLCSLRFTTTSGFSGAIVQLTDGTLTRHARTEGLTDVESARLSARNCDFDGDGQVGFLDFLSFARVFGSGQADSNYDAKFDVDGSNSIDFADFLLFAQDYGAPIAQ